MTSPSNWLGNYNYRLETKRETISQEYQMRGILVSGAIDEAVQEEVC